MGGYLHSLGSPVTPDLLDAEPAFGGQLYICVVSGATSKDDIEVVADRLK